MCDLYIITQCSSDAAEEAVRAALLESGVVDAGLCCHHKILFCETQIGRGAMARQLEPSLHIDSSARTLQSLAPFVPLLLGVRTPENAEVLDRVLVPNLTTVDDISDYFVKPSSRAQGEAWGQGRQISEQKSPSNSAFLLPDFVSCLLGSSTALFFHTHMQTGVERV